MSVQDAARAGRLKGLEALRDLLAAQLDTCESSRDVAALSRQFTDVLAQIDELSGAGGAKPGDEPASAVDEFTKRRQARGAS